MDDTSGYSGGYAEAPLVAATFPDAQEDTMLRTVGEGMIEASSPDGGNTLWYNSAFYQEPDAPHSVMEAANGVQWYAMQQQAQAPQFESGAEAAQYNQALFRDFMPGYEGQVAKVDGSHRQDGHFEVRNADGSGTAFYDTARYAAPRGDYQVMEALVNNAQSSAGYDVANILADYSASLEQKDTSAEDMVAKLTGISGQMFPVSYEEKQLERLIPVTYQTYKQVTVTVVTQIEAAGIVNGVPRFNYYTEQRIYYLPDQTKTSEVELTVPKYKSDYVA